MNDRVRSGIIYAAILLAFIFFSLWISWVPWILALIVAFLGSLELGQALGHKFRPMSAARIFMGTLSLLGPMVIGRIYGQHDWFLVGRQTTLTALWRTDMLWMTGLGMMLWLLLFVAIAFGKIALSVMRKSPAILPHTVAESAASFYLAMPLSVIVVMTYGIPDGFKWLALALLMPSVVDVSAYYVGSALGRKKIVPEISPHKTYAGFVGGLLIPALLVGLLFMVFFGRFNELGLSGNFLMGMLSGFLLSLAAQVGDWVASAVKRYCGIKDFSHLLPGHGGMIDRFDSVLYCLPMSLVMALVYNLIA